MPKPLTPTTPAERKRIFIMCAIVAALALAALAIAVIFTTRNTPQAGGYVTVTGEVVCLPHKNSNGAQTLECALGLRTDDSRHYALNYTDQTPAQFAPQVGDRITVSGELTTQTSNYDIVGTVKVDATDYGQ